MPNVLPIFTVAYNFKHVTKGFGGGLCRNATKVTIVLNYTDYRYVCVSIWFGIFLYNPCIYVEGLLFYDGRLFSLSFVK